MEFVDESVSSVTPARENVLTTSQILKNLLSKIPNDINTDNADGLSDLCDSTMLMNINQKELEEELEKIKKKVQLYEERLKDKPMEFAGYKYLNRAENLGLKLNINLNNNELKNTDSTSFKQSEEVNHQKDELPLQESILNNPEPENEATLLKKNLYEKAMNGQIDQLDDLLDMPGADINMTWFSENLLMCAIRYNQERTAEYLIKKGIDVHFETELLVSFIFQMIKPQV
jgi:hypothetical protein